MASRILKGRVDNTDATLERLAREDIVKPQVTDAAIAEVGSILRGLATLA